MAARSQRRALGALFFVLGALFSGMALAAAGAEVWVIAIAAGVLGVWMLGLAVRAWRR